MSNKQEPLSGGTSGTPAISSDPAEPFDFMLELEELDRVERTGQSKAVAPRSNDDANNRQSNVITRPPPPLVYSSPAASMPELSAPSLADQDWDEVTPRSSSVAAALLSSPEQLSEAPVSSDSNASQTPSTDPTGGRHPAPKPAPSSAPPFPFAPPRSSKGAGPAVAAPFPTSVPFPLTGSWGSAASSGSAASLGNATPSMSAAPLFSPPIVARAAAKPVSPASPAVSALPPVVIAAESAPPGPDHDARPGYQFSPSFTLDGAPITTRGTYKRGMEARVRAPKPPKYKWPATVAAAFALPFLGAIALTSWIESTRYKSAPGVPNPELPLAGAAAAPHLDAPPAAAVPQVAPDEHLPAPPLNTPVTLTQSLRGAPPNHPVHGAAKAGSVRLPEPTRSRPTLDRVDFGSGLTSATKTAEPSYRVKIPDEQKSLEPRNGAHNVPVNE